MKGEITAVNEGHFVVRCTDTTAILLADDLVPQCMRHNLHVGCVVDVTIDDGRALRPTVSIPGG
jgi:hypothetical protein